MHGLEVKLVLSNLPAYIPEVLFVFVRKQRPDFLQTEHVEVQRSFIPVTFFTAGHQIAETLNTSRFYLSRNQCVSVQFLTAIATMTGASGIDFISLVGILIHVTLILYDTDRCPTPAGLRQVCNRA